MLRLSPQASIQTQTAVLLLAHLVMTRQVLAALKEGQVAPLAEEDRRITFSKFSVLCLLAELPLTAAACIAILRGHSEPMDGNATFTGVDLNPEGHLLHYPGSYAPLQRTGPETHD